MVLFILESIGTSELLLIGLVALIFLGPRRLPEIARKIGKITAEFRGTATEFRQTWEREVNFEEERKALDLNAIDSESRSPEKASIGPDTTATPPEIRSVDPDAFRDVVRQQDPTDATSERRPETDKRTWL
jgi:sec-independent protein translocase protein TatB